MSEFGFIQCGNTRAPEDRSNQTRVILSVRQLQFFKSSASDPGHAPMFVKNKKPAFFLRRVPLDLGILVVGWLRESLPVALFNAAHGSEQMVIRACPKPLRLAVKVLHHQRIENADLPWCKDSGCLASLLNRLQKFQQVGVDFVRMRGSETMRPARIIDFL